MKSQKYSCIRLSNFENHKNLVLRQFHVIRYHLSLQLNAMANRAAGKGYESTDFYGNVKFQFVGIENIHVMRQSLQKLVEGEFTPQFPYKRPQPVYQHVNRLSLHCPHKISCLVRRIKQMIIHNKLLPTCQGGNYKES